MNKEEITENEVILVKETSHEPGHPDRWKIEYRRKEDDKRHRVGGPAVEAWDRDEYYTDGLLDRDDGPAFSPKSPDGRFIHFCRGLWHNEQGPAMYGGTLPPEFAIHGELISEIEHMLRTNEITLVLIKKVLMMPTAMNELEVIRKSMDSIDIEKKRQDRLIGQAEFGHSLIS